MQKMLFSVKLLLFSVLLQAFVRTASDQKTVTDKDVYKPTSVDVRTLNVVLLTLPESGNLSPLLALGEELVRRGHSVTLVTTTRIEGNFTNRTIEQAERVGVTYKSAGNSIYNLKKLAKEPSKDIWTILSTYMRVMPQEQETVIAFVDEYLKQNKVDIMVCTELLQPVMACINSAYQVPVVPLGTSLQYQVYTHPNWPWPGIPIRSVFG